MTDFRTRAIEAHKTAEAEHLAAIRRRPMTDFRTRAIEAHKTAEAEHLAAMRQEAAQFAVMADNELERWGIEAEDIDEIKVPDDPRPPYSVQFCIGDEVIEARRQYGAAEFYLAQTCYCGATIWVYVASLADIGKVLLEEQPDGCPRCDTGGGVECQTWRDRLADAITEAIAEAM